jgi:signal transduction histidine kinase
MVKNWKLLLVLLWLGLTFSLSGWWMVHGMRQADELGASNSAVATAAMRQHRMFFWEGLSLLTFVTVGGMALAYATYYEQRRSEELRNFFSTFTHELKTSLTSLRLQAEILEEDPKNHESENLRRLLRDVVRLELQLENALILAQAERSKLFLEEIPVRKILANLSMHWPQLTVEVKGDARVKADQRAFECILKNFLQNAYVHGGATHVEVTPVASEGGVLLTVKDNGKGFAGDPEVLGKEFVRHTTRSGAGIGLFLARKLAQRMGGKLVLAQGNPKGLEAKLQLAGRIA